jgi:hypothetical protein
MFAAYQYHQPTVQERVQLLRTVRILPVWNPVMEGTITICTLPTVLTRSTHSFFKPGPNLLIKKQSQNYGQGPKQLLQHTTVRHTLGSIIMMSKKTFYIYIYVCVCV